MIPVSPPGWYRVLAIIVVSAASALGYYAAAVYWLPRTTHEIEYPPWWEMLLNRSSAITGWTMIAAVFSPLMALVAIWLQSALWRRLTAIAVIAVMIAWDTHDKRPSINASQHLAHGTNVAIYTIALATLILAAAAIPFAYRRQVRKAATPRFSDTH